MKKYGILIAILIVLNLNAGPTPVPIELEEGKTVIKIDGQTCEITTIKTTTTIIQRDRAELQTELDHIPDRKAQIQEQLDAVNERETELVKILEVFK